MPKQILYYPELQQLMDKAWNDLERRTGRRISLRKAKTLLNTVSPSSLSSYRRGRQLPTDDDQIKKLAAFFYPNETDAQNEFTARVRGVKKSANAATGVIDPYDRVAAGNLSVKVGVVNYGPYAWDNRSQQGFFDNFFTSFLRYAAMEADIEKVDLEEAPRRLCKTNDVDVVLAILATPDRARLMKFFITPITIYVNAVVRKQDYDDLEANNR